MNEDLEKELARQIEDDLVKMLYSEIWLSDIRDKIEKKPIEIKLEYQQDWTIYMNRLWWSMPYPKGSFMGIVNITS